MGCNRWQWQWQWWWQQQHWYQHQAMATPSSSAGKPPQQASPQATIMKKVQQSASWEMAMATLTAWLKQWQDHVAARPSNGNAKQQPVARPSSGNARKWQCQWQKPQVQAVAQATTTKMCNNQPVIWEMAMARLAATPKQWHYQEWQLHWQKPKHQATNQQTPAQQCRQQHHATSHNCCHAVSIDGNTSQPMMGFERQQ